jgi:hypothetical protein
MKYSIAHRVFIFLKKLIYFEQSLYKRQNQM